jgi:hypothetical protein
MYQISKTVRKERRKLVPRRFQSGEVDYTGSISKCGDRQVRTLLYEAANVMLTRYRGGVEAEGLGVGDRQALHHAQGADRACPPPGHHHACDAQAGHRVQGRIAESRTNETGGRNELPSGATPEEGSG